MNFSKRLAYGFVLALLMISIITFSILLMIICRRKRKEHEESEQSLFPKKNSLRCYSFNDIYTATNGFDHQRIIGQGRFGTVYTAVLSRGELVVAIKRIHSSLVLSNAGLKLSSLLKTLTLAQHPNIVPILGISQAPGERIIVMEFVPMMGLDIYLHENEPLVLDWNQRLKIAAGAARGLEWLHGVNIVHGNFKSSNVLLDMNFVPRVSDYGLSFLCSDDGGCKENDVFGFGVVLLEILSGRRSEEGCLVRWAVPVIQDMRFAELFDSNLLVPCDLDPLVRLANLALACVASSRKNSLSISHVATILSDISVEFLV